MKLAVCFWGSRGDIMGMIYKRGRVYWIKYYRSGKPYRESTKSTKEADAKRLLKKREGEISEGKLPGIYFDRVRFDELANDFRADYKINQKKSLDRAQRSLKHLQKAFEGMRVTDITTPRINAYIETRISEGAANATINRELAALKRILNLGARQTPPKVAQIPYIPMLSENNVRKGFFEYGDFLALREALPDYLKGFVTFAYKSGWRKSEITNLTWNQVDLEQGIVRLEVGNTKNREGRTVYLDEELKEIFKYQWGARKKTGKLIPYVFTNENDRDKIKDFRGAWAKACENTGIGKRLFHDFRRTAVRDMIRSGIPERVAMMISGHKTRSVFDRYNIVSDTDLREAAARREAYQRSQTRTKGSTIHDFSKERTSRNIV
jgi:integrase